MKINHTRVSTNFSLATTSEFRNRERDKKERNKSLKKKLLVRTNCSIKFGCGLVHMLQPQLFLSKQ